MPSEPGELVKISSGGARGPLTSGQALTGRAACG